MISVVVPINNSSMYLERCIESILSQSYKDIELILVENNSTDNSYEICEKYKNQDGRIKLLIEKETGAAKARNRGILESKGDYITFVDSDDYLRNDAYEILINKMEKTGADAICYSYNFVDEYEKKLGWHEPQLSRYIKKSDTFSGLEVAKYFLESRDIEGFGWNKIFKMSYFRKNGFLFDEKKTAYEDMAVFFNAIIRCEKVVLCTEKLYYYRQRSSSLTHTFYERKNKEYEDSIAQIICIANSFGLKEEAEVFEISRLIWKEYSNMRKNIYAENQLDEYNLIHILKILITRLKTEKIKTTIKAIVLYCKVGKQCKLII